MFRRPQKHFRRFQKFDDGQRAAVAASTTKKGFGTFTGVSSWKSNQNIVFYRVILDVFLWLYVQCQVKSD